MRIQQSDFFTNFSNAYNFLCLIQLGSLYIPPPNIDDKQYLLSQQSPSWMSSKPSMDTPEWVNRDEIDNLLQQARNMHMTQFAGPKEHVVPISIEKSPTRNPTTPGLGPTPFYGTPQHHINSVITPKVGKFKGSRVDID